MNIYAPNSPPSSFWTRVAAELEEYKCSFTVLGWDLNCCLDNKLDRSPVNAHRKLRMGVSKVKMLENIDLTDVRWTLNPSIKDFMFYSNPHNSYSRIDYFPIPPQIMGQVLTCCIGSIHMSDHAPVFLEIIINEASPGTKRWRFLSNLLSDKDF